MRYVCMTPPEVNIALIQEIELTASQRSAIQGLLLQSFPSYPAGKLFYPQPPHFRLLSWSDDRLIGHLAGTLREVVVHGQAILIVGLVDLCIDHEWVGNRQATRLIEAMAALALQQEVKYLLAMTDDPVFYEKSGFVPVDTRCTWLAYMHGKSLGLFKRHPPAGLMVKALTKAPWPEGELDLMGPLF
jgi:hypothetical protein